MGLSLHVNRASHVWRSRQRLGAKTPQNEHGGTHYCDADGKKSNSDQALLPWLSCMARSRDWRKGRSTKRCRECGYEPVAIGAVERAPECAALIGGDSRTSFQTAPSASGKVPFITP